MARSRCRVGWFEKEDPATIPEPRADASAHFEVDGCAGDERAARKVPYDEPGSLAMLLDVKMQDDHFFDLVRFLNEKAMRRDPGRYAELARSFAGRVTAETG
ncbi:hypothetical protein AB0L75_35435 [Streptomyces sp. NPDC052101]|uniref:hypothetical protein n=1 Tax=Streptomyces sp. NPDC052101 TaxID=3155763 RepID=UPI00342353F5